MRRFGKVALWAAIGLCCIAAIETGQEMVKATDTNPAPQVAVSSSSTPAVPNLPAPTASQPDSAKPSTGLDRSASSGATQTNPAVTHRSAQAQPAQAQPAQAQRPAQSQKLAISTGTADDPAQRIAQINPTQVAARTWEGASFPVEGFQAYTSPLATALPYGGYTQEFHYGLDMAAPEGSYIRNWWSGKVIEVSDDSNCGTSVVVESGPWLHIYCHMQGHVEKENGKLYMIDREGGIQIWEGQQIQAGARLGRVGMTGRTTGPHLHWGLKYDDNWVDPALVLRAMYQNQQQTAVNLQERVQ
ncbi:MAG: M23 family metallopeptidase [Leptolyngbya sp. IPPAS B-1204]